MIDKIKAEIIEGKLPLHIISIKKKDGKKSIVKGRANPKYKTSFLQLSPFYKSVL